MNPEFVFECQSLLAEVGGDWKSIVFEVTEKIMLGPRRGQVFRALDELRARGAQIALDDFGTGYGGLKHLSGWPVDILKIDRQFVARMEYDATDCAIVEALVNLCDRADYAVVAEGIETVGQLGRLIDMRCGHGQGFLFSQPVPANLLDQMPSRLDMSALHRAGGPARMSCATDEVQAGLSGTRARMADDQTPVTG